MHTHSAAFGPGHGAASSPWGNLPRSTPHRSPHPKMHALVSGTTILSALSSSLLHLAHSRRHCESQGRPERTHHYPSASRYLGQRPCQTTSTRSEHRLSSEGCATVFALASGTIPIAAPQPPMPHLPWSRAPRSPASSISKQQPAQHLYMDASGSFGVAALAYPHWFQIQWGREPGFIHHFQGSTAHSGGSSHVGAQVEGDIHTGPRRQNSRSGPGQHPSRHSPLALLLGLLPSTLLDAGSAQSRVFKHKCQ